MIVFYHNKSKITEIVSSDMGNYTNEIGLDVVSVLLKFADKFHDEILVWCHDVQRNNLNDTAIRSMFHHNKFLFSYKDSANNYFDTRIGYIEDSPFVKVNKEIKYATWQVSSDVGAIHVSVLRACKNDLSIKDNFDYFLNSLAKRAMSYGLFCYSEPRLLLQRKNINENANSPRLYELFKFTKQHYRTRWIFLLFFNLLLFERKFPLLPFLISLFYRKRVFNSELLDEIPLQSNKELVKSGTIDVLIPTIGRKEYLLNVMDNLAAQTHLPNNVIIIEQNPLVGSQTELDFIENRAWPFTIRHQFTHQTGACNARNIGLNLIESEFVFFADDDIVFANDLLENAIHSFQTIGNEVFLFACHLKSQKVLPQLPKQFVVFGAGHAFVKSSCLKNLSFNMAFEFGFGEDNDFGMQLRNKGFDILYLSTSTILHLKAPMGGFRTKPVLRWENEIIQPKPSPTVMLFRLFYDSKEQLRSYKSTLFFKNITKSFLFNPFKYVKVFREKWDKSVYWANLLQKKIK